MQTAAAAPAPLTFSSPLHSPTSSSERIPPYWDEEREEWVGNPTEEEKFAALKAAIDEARAEYDAGLGIKISSREELKAFIHELSERAGERARARIEAQRLVHAS